MLASAVCRVIGDVHYLSVQGHVHRVLNTKAPVPGTDLHATLCEVSNTDHTASITRVLVLNLPSPSPLIIYDFLVLSRHPAPMLWCTGRIQRPREVTLEVFGEILFTCGPGGICGDRDVCDEHLQTIRRLAAPSCKEKAPVIDARFFETLTKRVVPNNAIGVWLETIVFRHYFLTENVLRAMCYANGFQARMLHGREQAIEAFMKRVEDLKLHVDRLLLSRFHELDHPSYALKEALASDLVLSPVSAAVLHCYPGVVKSAEAPAAASKCKGDHATVDTRFLDAYQNVSESLTLLEHVHKRHEAGITMFANTADSPLLKAAVEKLGRLRCLKVDDVRGRQGWFHLDWPEHSPQLLDELPLTRHTKVIQQKDLDGDDIEKFYTASKTATAILRLRGTGPWVAHGAEAREKTEQSVLLCICFSASGALFLHVAASGQRAKHGEDSVVMLDQPMSKSEIAQVFTGLGLSKVVTACVVYGSEHDVCTGMTFLEEIYLPYCETHTLAPHVLWIR